MKARCPECGHTVKAFWWRNRIIFDGHYTGNTRAAELCNGTGWLVEDDELVTKQRKQRSDAGVSRPRKVAP